MPARSVVAKREQSDDGEERRENRGDDEIDGLARG
jgi:hypothetical protein